MIYYAVINDAGQITMTTTGPGLPHAALWSSIGEADQHMRAMEKLNTKFGATYRIAPVRVEIIAPEASPG